MGRQPGAFFWPGRLFRNLDNAFNFYNLKVKYGEGRQARSAPAIKRIENQYQRRTIDPGEGQRYSKYLAIREDARSSGDLKDTFLSFPEQGGTGIR